MQVHSHNTIFVPTTLHSTPSSNQENQSTSIRKSLSPTGHDPDLAKLKARDREVRAHEAAHAAAAGSLAKGGPSYTYQRGSDGRLYATGGEVNIDTSGVPGDPKATIQKARQIRAAANAPANPSTQDRAVAAQASRMEAQARRELQQERTEALQEATSSPLSQSSSPHPIIDIFA